MFRYPEQSTVKRVVPKTKIYAQSKASRALQGRFAREVEKIVWRYKLSEETLNLAANGSVREILVFELHLKQNELHEDVLKVIDRTIRHPIAFQVHHGGKVRYVMAMKRPSEADAEKWVIGEYFWTDSSVADADLPPLPAVTSLQSLYEQVLAAHLPLPARDGESLRDHVERVETVRQKEREAAQLESRIRKEKQFNRKVEMNRKLRELNAKQAQLLP